VKLGEGGMGEVYRARDTRLHRAVAIKVLPDLFAADPDRLARFEREAQTLASLNHPHIAHIYGVEDRALVMELVEGEDLAQRIARGAIPADEAIAIARQIAEALEAAHARGIVHRDLKPANLKLAPDGTVKVLDFGLAKAMTTDPSRAAVENSPTFTSPAMTELGVILGTAAYMAPEQAKGRIVDARADIWAFGCVLYEMLTGRRAFGGEDVTDTIAAIIRSEPDWTLLPRDLSPVLASYLRRCVHKNPRERVQDAGDLRLALSGAFDIPLSSRPPSKDRPRRPILAVVAAAVALAGLAGAITWQLKPERASVPASIRRFTITPGPAPLAIANSNRDIAITPDGSAIIYLSGQGTAREIHVRRLDAVSGTVLRPAPRYYEPTVSPDSQWVAFNDEADYTLRKMSIAGGPIIAIAAVGREMLGATWGADDSIVYATDQGLWRVAAAGGTPVSLAKPDQSRGELAYAWPEFLPDGKTLLFTVRSGAWRGDVIAALDLKSGASKVVVRGATNPRYSRTGHLLYVADGIVRAVAFDPDSVEVRGEAVAVVDGVGAKGSGAADFAISADGTLVYVNGGPAVAQRGLAWIARDGTRQPLNAPRRSYAVARISPDGTRVALDVREQESDIWIWDLKRETLTRFTTSPSFDGLPAWLPDSRRIVFVSGREGGLSPFVQSADGTGEAQPLFKSTLSDNPTSITRDGKWLIFRRDVSNTLKQGVSDILMAPLDGREKPTPLLAGPATELNGEVSPDGRWLAYDSDESGVPEVYVRPFPQIQGGRWQITNGGGGHAAWDPNGRGMYYVSPDARLFFASWSATPAPSVGAPTPIETSAIYEAIAPRSFDVAPDGKRLLVIEPINTGPLDAPSVTVVLNWVEDLKRMAGSGSHPPR
jgi:serine/threonine protein kinase/Tol biopolymer transport system component